MIPDARRRTIEGNLAAWRKLARSTGCELIERDGLLTYLSLAPSPEFNPTEVTAPLSDPRSVLEAAEDLYADHGLSFGFEIPDGFDPATEEAAAGMGLTLLKQPPNMALALPRAQTAGGPAADVRLVTDATMLDDHIRVQAAGFGQPEDLIRTFTPLPVIDDFRLFVVYVDGSPVATSILGVTGAEAGIFGVSTHPDYRRRGWGRAATEAAVDEAERHGCDLVWLHASDMGFPVYRAMGFETVCTYHIYVRDVPDES